MGTKRAETSRLLSSRNGRPTGPLAILIHKSMAHCLASPLAASIALVIRSHGRLPFNFATMIIASLVPTFGPGGKRQAGPPASGASARMIDS